MSDNGEPSGDCRRRDGATLEPSRGDGWAHTRGQSIDAPSVCWIGADEQGEFAEAFELLSRSGLVVRAVSIDQAVAAFEQGDFPELIVLTQARPGEHAQTHVERLRRAAPLARIVLLCGSWCEGELRSGAPLVGVCRVYWHQWRPRLSADIERRRDGQGPSWGIPLTATEDDRVLGNARLTPAAGGEPRGAAVSVVSAAREMAEWLVDGCRAMGYSAAWRGHDDALSSPADLLIVDVADIDEATITSVRGFSQQRARPVIVLASFPRVEDVAHLTQAGAAAVLSKPLSVDDLQWQVERALAELARAPRRSLDVELRDDLGA